MTTIVQIFLGGWPKPKNLTRCLAASFVAFVLAANAFAQTTDFTFQGKLNDGGSPANSNYDMQFRLFDAAQGTTQIGSTLTITNVPTIAGIFTVRLDFGASSFTGGERYVEIGISPAGQNNFVTLAPRQRVTGVPYSIQSLNATTAETATNALNLGGLAANQYVLTNDARMSDARVPLPGSGDYVQNNAATPQPNVNLNIGGTGAANILDARTQFNLGGSRVLSTPGTSNLFVGTGTGVNNTSGNKNTFVGSSAGFSNTTGIENTFMGERAGFAHSGGIGNSFFGNNSGASTTIGQSNSFFGRNAGASNIAGNQNTFIGSNSGFNNTFGLFNVFLGTSAGLSNTTGNNNTIIGFQADFGAGMNNLNFASAIGSRARVSADDTIVIGKMAGTYNGVVRPADTVRMPGPLNVFGGTISVNGTGFSEANQAYLSFVDAGNSTFGYVGDGSTGDMNVFLASNVADVELVTPAGRVLKAASNGNVVIPIGRLVVGHNTGFLIGTGYLETFNIGNGRQGIFTDNVVLKNVDTFLPSPVHVCMRIEQISPGVGGNALVRCTTSLSSERFKTDFQSFAGGLEIIRRLNPVSFKWKEGGASDVGLNAEEVAEIAPELVTRSAKGEVEDVKENSLNAVFINAIKEQQKQIEAQAEQIKKQQAQLDALKKLVCQSNPQAEGCQEEQK